MLSDFHGLPPAIFVTTTVLAVIALGVGAGFGGAALAANADATACGDRMGCMIDTAARRREISDLALGADVSFGIAGLFALTSLVLVFVTDWGGRPVEPAETAFRLVPGVGPDGASLSVTGSF